METPTSGDVIPVMLLAGALVFVPLALLLAVQALRKMDRNAPPVPAAHGPRRRTSSSRQSTRRVNFGKRF